MAEGDSFGRLLRSHRKDVDPMPQLPDAKDFKSAEELEAWTASLPANEESYYLVAGEDIRPLSFVKVVNGKIFMAIRDRA